MTARLKPAVFSKGEPVEIKRRGMWSLGFGSGLRTELAQGSRRVTSADGGGEPHRLTRMSRTISRLNAITSMVVMMPRKRVCGTARAVGRFLRMASAPLRRAGARRLPHGKRRAGRHDQALRVIERARRKFEAEQAVALERARQRQLGRLLGREAEAGVVGRIAE